MTVKSARWIAGQFVRLTLERLVDHVRPDEYQQPERDPPIVTRDVLLEPRAQQPADDRHQELEQTEVETDPQRRPQFLSVAGRPGAERHGKRVHRQADRDQQYFKETHRAR